MAKYQYVVYEPCKVQRKDASGKLGKPTGNVAARFLSLREVREFQAAKPTVKYRVYRRKLAA